MAQERTGHLRTVFCGTPSFAASILERALSWPGHEIVGVYTQPDRPCGRGCRLQMSDVKQLALVRNIPIFQPEHFKSLEAIEELADLKPDVMLVAAYGLILPKAVLDIPRLGCINVHASLLPQYRGASPIQRAILAGDSQTGITIMQMNEGMDTGDMLLQRALGIDINDTASTLHDQLAELGGEMLVETLERLLAGRIRPIPQDDERATYAPKLRKEEGRIDFSKTVWEVHNQIRAMHPWPGAFFTLDKKYAGKELTIKVLPGRMGQQASNESHPGDILGLADDALQVACRDKVYLMTHVIPQNKKKMDATSFFNGYLTHT